MPKSESLSDPRSLRPAGSRPKFQFSLFWLMVAVTVVAVVLGLGASLGSFFDVMWYATFYFLRCALPTPLVIVAFFGHGRVRAFAIGALVPWVLGLVGNSGQQSLFILSLTICYSLVCGFLAGATWHWLQAKEGS